MTETTSPTLPFAPGAPIEHRGIVVQPLFPVADPVAEYLTLGEALARGLKISEVSDSGSVPQLAVVNPLDERVLLYDGEELIGAKQNRILNVTVLVEAGSSLPIPVSCVEEGRWSRRTAFFDAAPHFSDPELRRSKAEALAARPLELGVAQRSVWDSVRTKSERLGVHSPTGAQSDAFREPPRPARRARRGLPAPARARRARCSRSATRSASTGSRAPRRSSSCGPSSARATCSTRSTGSTGRPSRKPGSRPSSARSARRPARARPRPASARTSACAGPA